MIKFIGLKNCDSCKKARKWLEQHNVNYEYHDVRENGIDSAMAKKLLGISSIDMVVNKRSTTWRALDEHTKHSLNESSALSLLSQQPTLLKRPFLIRDEQAIIGFNESRYRDELLQDR